MSNTKEIVDALLADMKRDRSGQPVLPTMSKEKALRAVRELSFSQRRQVADLLLLVIKELQVAFPSAIHLVLQLCFLGQAVLANSTEQPSDISPFAREARRLLAQEQHLEPVSGPNKRGEGLTLFDLRLRKSGF